MQQLDIINLIENNPITKLSQRYNNKFLTRIKENFTELEQQLFVSSFYCYLNYNQTTDFVINLDDIWKWIGFSVKAKAKTLLERNFKANIDYKILFSEQSKQYYDEDKKHGGHNKENIMLTIKSFKLFCIKADTQKSTEIHEYFIKLEEILQQITQEESNELKLQLEQAKNEIYQIEETNKKELNIKISKEREQFLLREFGTIGSIIYIVKVKTYTNGQYVIKIGESRRGIQMRYNEHKSKYEEILLLDCFSVKKSKDFESFLHTHEDIKFNRVTDLEGHENEIELFLIGKKLSYKMLLHIINSNIKNFNDYNEIELEKLRIENETLKSLMNNSTNLSQHFDNLTIQKILDTQKEIMNQIHNLEKTNKEILGELHSMKTKTTTNFHQHLSTIGPRLQQINPENMSLVKVYETIAECLKEHCFKIKRASIVKSIHENTIYYGYRWAYVDRNENPTIIGNILPTKHTRIQNNGYIAKVNKEKTEIINVYLDRKSACICEKYKSGSVLDTPVKNKTLYNGYYYMLYEKCEEHLRQSFIKKNCVELILYKDGVGQFDLQNNLIKEFSCKHDCIKKLQISDKTLAKILDKDIQYKIYYFRSIGSKLKCI